MAEPPAGSRGRTPGQRVRGRSPPEAEKLFSLERPKKGLFSALFVLSRGLWTVIVDRGLRFRPFRVSTWLLLASLQKSACKYNKNCAFFAQKKHCRRCSFFWAGGRLGGGQSPPSRLSWIRHWPWKAIRGEIPR